VILLYISKYYARCYNFTQFSDVAEMPAELLEKNEDYSSVSDEERKILTGDLYGGARDVIVNFGEG